MVMPGSPQGDIITASASDDGQSIVIVTEGVLLTLDLHSAAILAERIHHLVMSQVNLNEMRDFVRRCRREGEANEQAENEAQAG